MIKCWIIRSFFIGVLLVCVVVWVGSYFRSAGIAFNGAHRLAALDADWGEVHITDVASARGGSVLSPFYCGQASPAPVQTWLKYMSYHFLGFAVMPYHDVRVLGRTFSWGEAMFPLWFPALLSGLLLWFVWRMTRPKIPMERAFPLEPANPGDSKP